MAQAYTEHEIILVPKGTLKQIKTMISLGISQMEIPWIKFQTRDTETLHTDALGEGWLIVYTKNDLTLATTIRWRELTLSEQKALRWRNMMAAVDSETQAQDVMLKALRASHRDDVADAISHSIIRSIPKVKPDGNQ